MGRRSGSELQEEWVVGSSIVYVGQTKDIVSRIRLLARFAYGEPVPRWGGRYLWQLLGREALCIAWLPTPDVDPAMVETRLLRRFASMFGGHLPFANLVKGKGAGPVAGAPRQGIDIA